MKIETTINISKQNYQKILKCADSLKISKNELVFKLLVKYLNMYLNNYAGSIRVRYQEREKKKKWKAVHVWLSPEFYDKCQDMRRFQKLSVSYILAKAMELYLQEILNGECDNYFHNYIFISFIVNKCPIFIVTWDYPGNEYAKRLLDLCDNNT